MVLLDPLAKVQGKALHLHFHWNWYYSAGGVCECMCRTYKGPFSWSETGSTSRKW